MMNRLALIFLLTLQPIFAADFASFLQEIPYKSVTQKLSAVEKREFEKIYFENRIPRYEDRLIKLYLVASEINTDEDFQRYFSQFEELVNRARQIEGLNSLNRYNRAEKLLHFLHDESFSKELTGPAAGYNIGIKETLDNKVYNCYKSALIYNALLEYFDYQTYLVLVPEHIYTVVLIDGKEIPVETTNRFGFDSKNAGAPEFTRKFDKPNVQLVRKTYRKETPIDNVTAAGVIYNNLLLLYAGREKYPGYPVQTDMHRSAMLGMLGLYITGENEAISNNVQYPFFRITESAIKDNPELLENEYSKMYSTINRKDIQKYNKEYIRNLSILVLDTLPAYRKSVYGEDNTLSIQRLAEAYRKSLIVLEKLSLDKQITDSGWKNSIIQYMESVSAKTDTSSYNGIKEYVDGAYTLLNNPELQKSPMYQQYQKMLAQYATTELNNYIAGLINSDRHEQAYREAQQGIAYLKELNFYHPQTMRTLEKNYKIIEDYMKNR